MTEKISRRATRLDRRRLLAPPLVRSRRWTARHSRAPGRLCPSRASAPDTPAVIVIGAGLSGLACLATARDAEPVGRRRARGGYPSRRPRAALLDLPERPEASGSEVGAYYARILEQIRRFGLNATHGIPATSTSRCRCRASCCASPKDWSRQSAEPHRRRRAQGQPRLHRHGLTCRDYRPRRARQLADHRATRPIRRSSHSVIASSANHGAALLQLACRGDDLAGESWFCAAQKRPATGAGRRPAARSCR